MSMDMIYIAGKDELSFQLSPASVDTMEFLANKGFQKEVEAILGVSDFDQETPAGRKELLDSIERLIKAVESNPQLIPYTYSFKIERPLGSGIFSIGSGRAAGIYIESELYTIEGGFNHCILIKKYKDKNGKGKDGEVTDIRDWTKLKSNSHGEIIILKRRRRTCFMKNLKQLRDFLTRAKVDVVKKML